jgi:hypothetical protein
MRADIRKSRMEAGKLYVEGAKLIAETAKINRERAWIPFVAGGAFVAAIAGALVALVKLIG